MAQKYIIETDDMRDVIAFNESKKLRELLDDLLSGMLVDIKRIAHDHESKNLQEDPVIVDYFNKVEITIKNIRKRSDALKYDQKGESII